MPTPEIGEDDVLVRVRACGICGSDIHGYDGSTGRRIPPLVMGHEAAGVIERAGRAVEGFAVGDRVTFDSTVSCGKCDFCRQGQINLCDNRMVLGVSCGDYRRHGAFAEYVVGARAHSLQASRQPAVRARGADRSGVDRGPCGEPPRAEARRCCARRRVGHDRRAGDSGAARQGLPQHHRGRSRRRQARAGDSAWAPRAR